MNQFLSAEFARFLLTGGIAALVNFGSRLGLEYWMPFSAAVLLAYVIGMATAFLLAKIFVFKQSTHELPKSALYFVGVNLVAILQTWAVSMGLAFYLLPWLGVSLYRLEIAHAVGLAVPVFSSYIGHKYLSFR